ncbi:MAG: hypothetical protein RLY20_1105 [Verrucomicrobiota bacterium]
MADATKSLLTDLLKQVSRSFYLTLRIVPASVRAQIGLAYLLARTTDTIADTEILPIERRLAALSALRAKILGTSEAALNFSDLAQHQGSPAERTLLERIEESVTLLRMLQPGDLAHVRNVIDFICSGQELDLKRFNDQNQGEARRLTALSSERELDDYTYRVAGCVGEFWTHLCFDHLYQPQEQRRLAANAPEFQADAVRFGKGLQLVNILRDLPRDLRQGRCYIPQELLAEAGLRAEDLLHPANEPRFRPVYDRLVTQAETHLAAGWRYTSAIPHHYWRMRLACAWPILIGVHTITLLRINNILDPATPLKVPRSAVRTMLIRTLVRVPFAGALERLWTPAGQQAGKAVASRQDLT